jgi:hypothetical protein
VYVDDVDVEHDGFGLATLLVQKALAIRPVSSLGDVI